jgi:hypothetical protein
MFIPPHTYVRRNLQKASVYKGFSDPELYQYTKQFLKFAKSVTPSFYKPLIRKIEDMVRKKRSVSDEMLTYARRNKLMKNGVLTKKGAKQLALYYSKKWEDDLRETKQIVLQIMDDHRKFIGSGLRSQIRPD